MTDGINWNDDRRIVVTYQPATAIQGDANGRVMIRQEGRPFIEEDQFVEFAKENVLAACKAMLRSAGLHGFEIVPVDQVQIVRGDGKVLTIPEEDLRKLERIAEAGRLEELALTEPLRRPERTGRTAPKDPTAAERKRRQRAKQRPESRIVTAVTERDTATVTPRLVTAVPRLPLEIDQLQHGGAKKPALTR